MDEIFYEYPCVIRVFEVEAHLHKEMKTQKRLF